jgi:hypothetical protein
MTRIIATDPDAITDSLRKVPKMEFFQTSLASPALHSVIQPALYHEHKSTRKFSMFLNFGKHAFNYHQLAFQQSSSSNLQIYVTKSSLTIPDIIFLFLVQEYF